MHRAKILDLCHEVSSLAKAEWSSAASSSRDELSHERVLFEAFQKVASSNSLSTVQVVEVIEIYLSLAKWEGMLVRDSSARNGNSSGDVTWALVRPKGILASFGGRPFQTIYEPHYDMHNEHGSDLDRFDYILADIDDPESMAELGRHSDEGALRYLKGLFGIPLEVDGEGFVATLPDGFRNPLKLGEFANGAPGQDVVAVSYPLMGGVALTVQDWIAKRRNSQGTASNFDILASAAIDCNAGRPITRQLRSWTEDQYLTLREDVLLIAAVWPQFLSGKLILACDNHKSWIVLEQEHGVPLLFQRENLPVITALSRILAAISELRTFRGMACSFDLTLRGRLVFKESESVILRALVDDFITPLEECKSASARLAERLESLGHDGNAVRSSIPDPVILSRLIDPDNQLLRSHRSAPEERLFRDARSLLPKMHRYTIGQSNSSWAGDSHKDSLYGALGGDGKRDVYLSDGLWLAQDGIIRNNGR